MKLEFAVSMFFVISEMPAVYWELFEFEKKQLPFQNFVAVTDYNYQNECLIRK